MRACSGFALLLVAPFFNSSLLSKAQPTLPLPGCETSPEVREVLDKKLDSKLLDRMKFGERLALERRTLEDLIARYPREFEPYQILSSRIHQYAPDEYPALRDRWVKMAKDHPDDPLALLLAISALWDKDTPQLIRLLEAARTKAPTFPWPARQLAGLYSTGKRADQNKARENLEAFFAICPGSMDGYAQFLLTKYPSLQPKAAAALRARLKAETDPNRLWDYNRLWGQEFRSRPPQEHDGLRAQVARDLKRLEALDTKDGARWQALLINGYKQTGASKEAITAMEDRLVREYPHSNEAYGIVRNRWDEAHKEPTDANDAAAWAKYQREYQQALKGWIRDYRDSTYLQHEAWFDAIWDDHTVSERDGIAALDTYLQYANDYKGPAWIWYFYPKAAQFLIERGWQPARALDLLKQARTDLENTRARDRDNDNLSNDDLQRQKDGQTQQDLHMFGQMLKAAMQAGQPAEALKLRGPVEMPLPPDKKFHSQYWRNRARLEAIQNHTLDALAFYQFALQTRAEPPKASRGKLRDDLTDEARSLWKAQGGTEAVWALWSKSAAGGTEQLAEGRWAKPTKPIPAFELADLTGKIWRLKKLEGKSILINVWATWCGPCQAELPHLQKFYEKVKNRTDIQVLTFNIDANLGLVGPYLREKGYTFPVLPAYSAGVLDDFGVPQTWVVDPHGIWRWKQSGYAGGTYADFEKQMLQRLEATKGE